ncbi:MAG: hypothetical protein JWN71_3223 [Xanthobacteraceae bacterium]|nr:hypothetical protein [Xanthobacteraceae bacterium]
MPAIQPEPKSRERSKIRLALDHPEAEAIAKRVHLLMCMDVLNDDERGNLIKKYSELRKVDFRLARRVFEGPLPVTDIRPMFYDDHCRPGSGVFGRCEVEVWAGWVFRLRDYVAKLEHKHLGSTDDDDI